MSMKMNWSEIVLSYLSVLHCGKIDLNEAAC